MNGPTSSPPWQMLAVPAPDDTVQLGRQLGDKMLPVPGELGLVENLFLHVARQMWPRRDHRRPQPAHQTFVFGRISVLFVFHERHTRAFCLRVDDGAGQSGNFDATAILRRAKAQPTQNLDQIRPAWEWEYPGNRKFRRQKI